MGTWSKVALNGSTAGQGISVTGTSPTTGTVLHTPASGGGYDEVVVYAYNPVTDAREISFSIGPTTSPNSRWTHVLPATPNLAGLQPVVPGLLLTATGSVLRAYATANDAVRLFGWVNRYAT